MNINNLLNFAWRIIEMWRAGSVAKIGFTLLSFGTILLGAGSSYYFSYSDAEKNIDIGLISQETSLVALIFGIVLISLGIFILIKQYIKLSKEQVVFYFGNLLSFGDSKAPIYAMTNNDRLNVVEEYFDIIDSYDKDSVIDDYKHNKKSFKNRSKHKDVKKIYLAALGSFPYLYLLGTLIRNGHIDSVILDYDRNKNKWQRLENYSNAPHHLLADESDINEKIIELCNKELDDIGIALSYTFEINKESLPPVLQENTLLLKNSFGYGHDKLSEIQSQTALLNELALYIDKFKSAGKNVHLFVSAQASFCINMGKRYQDNTMGAIHVYNFDNDSRKYNWFITFNKGNVT